MSVLEDKAREVSGYMLESKEVDNVAAFDPMTILMIISIICSAIQIWQRCGAKPNVVADRMKENSTLTRLQLRRLIREKGRELPHAQRKEFRESMEAAITKMGANITVEDVQKLFAEVDEHQV
jgi:hypothetical protein